MDSASPGQGKFCHIAFVLLALFVIPIIPAEASSQERLVKRTRKVVGHRRVYRNSKSSKRSSVGSGRSTRYADHSDNDNDWGDVFADVAGDLLGALLSGDDDETSDEAYEEEAYLFDFERRHAPTPNESHIFFGGIGTSFRLVEAYGSGYIPALSY